MCLVPREFPSRVPPTLLTDAVADSEGVVEDEAGNQGMKDLVERMTTMRTAR